MILALRAWPLPAFLFLAFLVGCDRPGAAPAEKLETVRLTIAGHSLTAEIAATPEQQARGLMFRKSMPADHGMLFPFPEPRTASFWMRNTSLPLSIAYLDSGGVILEIHDMKPFDERTIRSASDRVSYALEVHQGWFRRHGITPGDRVLGLPPPPN
jgi:uncharacterized membrane protein (UPF0127 family)